MPKRKQLPTETPDILDEDEDLIEDGDLSSNDGDAIDEEDESYDHQEPVVKKRKGGDAKFKLPTSAEIHALTQTADLFQSNLFKLQIDELLSQVAIDYSKSGLLDKALHSIKSLLDGAAEIKEMDLSQSITYMKNRGVQIPFGSSIDENVKYKFSFKAPEKIFIAGSYLVKTVAKGRNGFNVDVAVQMPKSIFTEKDHVNNRYFHKRAFYLAAIAATLKTHESFKTCKFTFANDDPRRPIISIRSDKSSPDTDFGNAAKEIEIRIFPVISPDFFPAHRLAPGRNNNRPLSATGEENSDRQLPATPRYNSSLLMDTMMVSHLNLMHKLAASCESFRDAVILGKVWLNQRGLNRSSCGGGFTGFLWSCVIAYLLGNGCRNNQSSSVFLKDSYSSYQIVKLTIEFLATHDFAAEPIFMTPDGQAIDHPDFSAKSFSQHFDCVIVDPSGRINLAAFINSSTLNHLQYEAKASWRLFNDLGSDRFDALFLTNLTDPIGYYDLMLRINSVPTTFAAYKANVKLDFPNKRQFFAHFVSRLLRLGIKTRTQLIHLTDRGASKSSSWSIDQLFNTELDNADDDVALYVGLVLDQSKALESVEYGPKDIGGDKEEYEKQTENFRRLWGKKASLRRFQDGSIAESVVWLDNDTDVSLDSRVMVTAEMAGYLLERHIGVKPEEILIWGHQFKDVLREFGGGLEGKNRTEQEKRTGTFQNLVDAFNAFSKAIKGLEGIPLDVTSVIACDPGLRYTSVFVPQPAILSDTILLRQHPIKRDQIEVLIDLESSPKWPNTIPALQNMKLAFYCKIAQLIGEQIKGALAIVEKPDLLDVTTGVLDVRMPSGYCFRARLRTGLEVRMATEAEEQANSSGADARTKLQAFKRTKNAAQVFVKSPAHTLRVQNIHFRFPHFSQTVRLVKRWVSAHWLGNHLSQEAIEIITTAVFTNVEPYASAPGSPFVGLLRVLERLSSPDFGKEEVMVEFEKGDVFAETKKTSDTENGDIALTSKLDSRKKTTNGSLRLVTALDLEGYDWTWPKPAPMVLARIRHLAKASCKVIKDNIATGGSEIMKIFVTPRDAFDFVIHLDPSKVPSYHQNIAYDESILPKQKKSKFKNLALAAPDPLLKFLESFDPVEKYVQDLDSSLGESVNIFYDVNGGIELGILLNRKVVVPQQPWKVGIPYCVTPLLEEKDESNGSRKGSKKQKTLVTPDYQALLGEIERLGSGLAVSLESKKQ